MALYLCSRLERVIWNEVAADVIAREAEALGARRVFIVASGTLASKTGEIDAIRAALGDRAAGQFSGIGAHVPSDVVFAGAAAAREAGADLLVAVGGGSVVDGTKLIQMLLAGPDGRDLQTCVAAAPARLPVRQIAVPTTLSAAEFGSGAGSTDPARRQKTVLRHPDLIPMAVVLDPAITLNTPLWLWLSTGIRAVDHAVETLCSIKANPFTDATAVRALMLLNQGLRRTAADPSDLAARLDCQLAAWLSMTAVPGGIPLGASHAIGHVLGGAFNVPHGHTSCVMLPAVLTHNESVTVAGQESVSAALGRPGVPAAQAVGDLIAALGLPRRLGDIGISEANFPTIAAQTLHERWASTNPVQLASEADVIAVLRRAL